jgi:triosephosphate isomerase
MKILIANWKLNPVKLSEAQKLVAALNKVRTKNKVVICPPFPYLPLLKTKFDLGSQDISDQAEGPFTAEVSAEMLKQFKVKYAIIGHSNRRALGESDAKINAKLKQAIKNKIIPVLCTGFGLTMEQSNDEVLMHIQHQLLLDLNGIDPKKVIVVYEPVWAISSNAGKAATPEHAERVAMFIRIKFKVAKVLYGGSANEQDFRSFLERDIDGLLVGAASLKKEQFSKMIQY